MAHWDSALTAKKPWREAVGAWAGKPDLLIALVMDWSEGHPRYSCDMLY